MTIHTNPEMHAEHRLWNSEHSMWRDDIQMWREEHQGVLAGLPEPLGKPLPRTNAPMGNSQASFSLVRQTKPFMPPFAGTALEVEALVQFLSWNHQGNPDVWPMTSAEDDSGAITARIQGYLDEAGTEPA